MECGQQEFDLLVEPSRASMVAKRIFGLILQLPVHRLFGVLDESQRVIHDKGQYDQFQSLVYQIFLLSGLISRVGLSMAEQTHSSGSCLMVLENRN